MTCQQFICFDVFADGFVDNILRQLVACIRVSAQPIADKLFVIGGLALANFVAFQRPEAGAVRGNHFVTQYNLAVLVQTKFKFGVGNDDAALQSISSTFFVDSDSVVTQLQSIFFATARIQFFQDFDALLYADVFVMVTDFSLGAGGEDRFSQLLGFLQAFGKFNAADFAGWPSRCR